MRRKDELENNVGANRNRWSSVTNRLRAERFFLLFSSEASETLKRRSSLLCEFPFPGQMRQDFLGSLATFQGCKTISAEIQSLFPALGTIDLALHVLHTC